MVAALPPASSAALPASPWHEGEITLQRAAGVDERMDGVGRRVIRDYLLDQHRDFYALLPFVVLGAVDAAGDAWATLRAGPKGFLQAPDEHHLHLDLARDPADPADAGFEDGKGVGLLGIELQSRRRNRLNGTISRSGAASGFDILVTQSFGNCPQYIQQRDFTPSRDPQRFTDKPARIADRLDAHARAVIAAADTFFIASYADTDTGRQVDVSHRGGRAGFVRIDDDGTLTIPDFAGNLFFATLGNILLNGKAGLVFADFESGDLLQLTGTAEVILDSPEIAAFQGAERLLRVTPRRVVYRPDALPLRWSLLPDGWSPNSLMTGSWDEAATRLQAAELAKAWRPFRVARIVDESSVIRSFHLEPVDGAGIIPHQAGQHLPIRVTPLGSDKPVLRTYTLSVAPSDSAYRLSIKREGVVSRHLHDNVKVGDIIEARAPAGDFTIDAVETRPAVLMAAGIGVTPMLAMLRHIVYEGLRKRRIRPTWFFYAARSKAERAFDAEIASLVEAAQGMVHLVRVLSDPATAAAEDYDVAGRIDMALLKAALPFNDYDFYLCGPAPFMQSVYDGLRGLSIADARIHAEAFGPASLNRKPDAAAQLPAHLTHAPATASVKVVFAGAGKEARWEPGGGSLLELAEARGLQPEFSCRGGTCGTCRTRILEGAVAYTKKPTASVAPDEALICCAVPAAAEDGGGERLQLDL
ncbi:MAG TPA: pyridoxamine 5'-phosphate oxidase family protein [Terriglobia bacterium]|nr:pyridoxamine 5'-phosphate oxidase family protein [Terriglobia bacterium]